MRNYDLFLIVLQKEKKWNGIEESWIVFEETWLWNFYMQLLPSFHSKNITFSTNQINMIYIFSIFMQE